MTPSQSGPNMTLAHPFDDSLMQLDPKTRRVNLTDLTAESGQPLKATLINVGAIIRAIDVNLHFAATRRHIREFLQSTDTGRELQDLVFELIG